MPPIRSHRARLGGACALFALTLAGPSPAAGRELHWTALEVTARLDAEGRLLVSERHEMVMTGDWNGGERRFRREPGQRLELVGMTRIDPASGVERPLERGGLDRVDHFDWADAATLRWRSRRPSDPPFAGTRLIHRIDYVLTGALEPLGGGSYRLAHDFAFGERDGVIERFSLDFEVDPAWRPGEGFAPRAEAGPLAPGESYVVRADFVHRGATGPRFATAARIPAPLRAAVVGATLGGALVLIVAFARRERALGRFAPLPPRSSVDRDFLERAVFALPPELVGAAWDRAVGAAEVAAMVARLIAEGKLVSEVEAGTGRWFRAPNLQLELRVERNTLAPLERRLIQKLFPSGDRTDSRLLREHYAGSGFDPAAEIRGGLEARLREVDGFDLASPGPRVLPLVALGVGGIGLLIAGAVTGGDPSPVGLAAVIVVSWLPALGGALAGRTKLGVPAGAAVALALSLAAASGTLALFGGWPDFPLGALVGGGLLALALFGGALRLLATRESERSIARRRELAAARRFFAEELKRAEPRLEDGWYPWLVALGLAPQAGRWFRRFGGALANGGGSTPGAAGSGSSPGGGWSGGGGAFGGAGASASFAAAITSMSAGVAAPSSSGGGGGGGGSSSGGGGGGGW